MKRKQINKYELGLVRVTYQLVYMSLGNNDKTQLYRLPIYKTLVCQMVVYTALPFLTQR